MSNADLTDLTDVVAGLIESYNRRDPSRLAAGYAAGAQIQPAGLPGPIDTGTWTEVFGSFLRTFPDFTAAAGRVTTSGSVAMAEVTLSGTNTGPVHLDDFDRAVLRTDARELPPTGRPMSVDGVIVLAAAGGLITAERHHFPFAGLLEQLGLIETGVVQSSSR